MKREKIFFILFIILFFLNCNSRDNFKLKYKYSQEKHEKIILSDLEIFDSEFPVIFPDEKSPDWKPAKLPFIHRMKPLPYYGNYYSFWLRGKFRIKENKAFVCSACYGIRLGLVSAANVVHINGTVVGFFNSTELDKWPWPRSYVFPGYINFKETNEVYIYFFTGNNYITLTSDIVIQDERDFLQDEKWNNFLYNQLPMGFCILFISALILFLYNFFFHKNKRYLFYSLYLLNIIFILILVYFPLKLLPFELTLAIIYSLPPINLLLTAFIFQSFYGIYFWKHNIITAVIVILVSFFIFTRISYPIDIYVFLKPVSFVSFAILFYLIYLIYLLNSLKKDRYKYYFSISLFFFRFIIEIIQLLGIIFNIWYQYFNIIYSTLFFAVFIIVFETRENKQRKIELEELYGKLKTNIVANNHLLTESAETKIGKIMTFLHENFSSDISREGLAYAVDMSPNYMSKIFCKHTGKKINEYINILRITHAARQLEKSDNRKRIIDIALASGFESLSTFNRAFKNIYNITPTEYKKKFSNDSPQIHSVQ